MKELVKILNKVTNNVFTLTEEEAREVISSNPSIFVALDKEIKLPDEPTDEPTVTGIGKLLKDGDYSEFEKMTVPQLKKYCKDNEINIDKLTKKDEILARIKGE